MRYYTQLSSLLAVYRCGSLRKAATELGITQPAITKHLQVLEKELGKKLFHRKGRNLVPSHVTKQLISSIAPHFDAVDALLNKEKPLSGTVTLSMDNDIYRSYISKKLLKLANDDIQFVISDKANNRFQGILDGDIDFAITRNVSFHHNATCKSILEETQVLVGSPQWAKKINPEKLKDNDCTQLLGAKWVISPEAEYFIYEYLSTVFNLKGLQLKPAVSIADLNSVLHTVKEGSGITVLPKRLCEPYIQSGELEIIYQPKNAPSYEIFLVWKSGKLRFSHYKEIHECLLNCFK